MTTLQKLQEILGKNVQENVPLAPYSTFKLGGPARYFFVAKTSNDIVLAATAAKQLNLEIFLLAGGSNLLISDDGFDGLVIKAENNNIALLNNDISSTAADIKAGHPPDCFVKAEGGAVWNDFINFVKEQSLVGVEWGAGIPGTVGGAIRGNAGAFGQSVQEVIQTAEVLDLEISQVQTMQNSECAFDYRDSIFKKNKNLIILSGIFQLPKGDRHKIEAAINKNLEYRKNSQPCLPSAGCIFKNILVDGDILRNLKAIDENVEEKIRGGKIGSAWLIDKAGLKGKKIGGVQVSDDHANFIVKSDDSAKADHAVQLISYIKQQVRDKFGVQLQEEVQYAGF